MQDTFILNTIINFHVWVTLPKLKTTQQASKMVTSKIDERNFSQLI